MLKMHELLNAAPLSQISYIRLGLLAQEAVSISVQYQISLSDIARVLHIPLRSLQYLVRQEQELSAVTSERLFRLARVASYASCIYGDLITTGNWLTRPNSVLNQMTPLSLLDTAYGGQEVERILRSIEYGLPV
ncbi:MULTISPECIES: antitoxin Xre/MbcA/ParS toxin-binding domain-containing protein [Deefgea]|uniref:DUF2384 domain-containing protein n=1 Tax=Deefgea chitinilytica TaxID=570276 RepID=A0ABS2C9B9_9NEIS|nr:DUF2384 domain-containing protein [Deefgea chitinilytica]MBM9887969.1 DUF2384 domain-containing protein [Deefgea sp. CFH1-16]